LNPDYWAVSLLATPGITDRNEDRRARSIYDWICLRAQKKRMRPVFNNKKLKHMKAIFQNDYPWDKSSGFKALSSLKQIQALFSEICKRQKMHIRTTRTVIKKTEKIYSG
jgi:hypothetical protein